MRLITNTPNPRISIIRNIHTPINNTLRRPSRRNLINFPLETEAFGGDRSSGSDVASRVCEGAVEETVVVCSAAVAAEAGDWVEDWGVYVVACITGFVPPTVFPPRLVVTSTWFQGKEKVRLTSLGRCSCIRFGGDVCVGSCKDGGMARIDPLCPLLYIHGSLELNTYNSVNNRSHILMQSHQILKPSRSTSKARSGRKCPQALLSRDIPVLLA